ncbi:MAG: hypothetical protein RSF90_00240 [Pygmaiobacter sp.]
MKSYYDININEKQFQVELESAAKNSDELQLLPTDSTPAVQAAWVTAQRNGHLPSR